MQEHPQMSARFALFSLFKPQIIRVVLNPVKLTGTTGTAAAACCRITLRICKTRCGWQPGTES
uniref:Aerobactin synthase, aerobactin biosynthesis protein IucC n=1 Tax=Klebsiella pneumoniae TaxID=573 RepID=A0A8B0SV41_KLEPN|nr:Aerobactin synthase, aerobactin biosynthesis protein IucC [Klebsiella pneumoniae]